MDTNHWDASPHVGAFPNRIIRKIFKKTDLTKLQFFKIFCSNQYKNSRIRIRTKKEKGLSKKKIGSVRNIFVKKLNRKKLNKDGLHLLEDSVGLWVIYSFAMFYYAVNLSCRKSSGKILKIILNYMV